MERFRAIIAMLESSGKQWDHEQKEALCRLHDLRDILTEIAERDNGWAGERAKRALAETESWYY